MKILNVNISIDSIHEGGTAERTFQMSRYLATKNYDCTILTLFSHLSDDKYLELNGINVIMLPYLFKRFYIPKGGLRVIKRAVYNADIVHLMSHWTLLNAIVYCFIRYYEKPYLVCPAGALPIFGRSKIIKKIYNYIIGNKIVKNANGHIAIAENEYEQYRHYGIDRNQITLIPNGVNSEDFKCYEVSDASKKSYLPEEYILFMGRLNYIKGPDLLLQAYVRILDEYPNYHLVFAGPNDGILDHLINMVKECNATSRVHFMGYVGIMDKIQLYQNASFLVIPSRKEAMSIVLLEAGMLEKSVLITDQCGFDMLENINGGYVVPATTDAIKSGLLSMLSNPDRLKMGMNLKNFILKHYTWDTVGDKISMLFKCILGKIS